MSAARTVYEQCREQVDAIREAYDGLLAACDSYTALLQSLVEKESAADEPRSEMIRRLRHQESETRALIEGLETRTLDDLLRIVDRVLMIDMTDRGKFV